MIDNRYIAKVKEILEKYLTHGEKVFIFGSSAESDRFNDVDLAIVSDSPEVDKAIYRIKEDLEESTLPYKFDVVNINKTNDPFRTRVLNGPKIWIT